MKIQSMDRWEKVGTIIMLLSASGSIPISPPQEISLEPLGGRFTAQLITLVTYLILTFVLFRHWKRIVYVSTRNLSVLLLLGTIALSVFWSVSPEQTIASTRGLFRNTLLGIYLASRYTIREQIRLLAWVLGVTALFSLILCLFFSPFGYGIHRVPSLMNAWCGVYGHKNALGSKMSWSAAIFLDLALSNSRSVWVLWLGFCLSSFLVIKSTSTGSLAILLVSIITIPFYRLIQKNNYKVQVISIITAIYLFIGGTLWLQTNLEGVVNSSGKDLTLTGRTEMWFDLIEVIGQKPFLGYGFDAFYSSDIPEYNYLSGKYPWASSPHNGFLQLMLALGLVGASFYMIGYLQYLFKALKRIILFAEKVEDYWPMQMLIVITMNASSEATLVEPSSQTGWGWMLYVATLLSMTIEYRRMSFMRIFPSTVNQEL